MRWPALLLVLTSVALHAAPLPIADVKRADPVNFDRDILPFFNDNCLACHCKTTTKGGLNLETPELMLKGGETGPSIVRGKSAESLVLQAAAHLESDLAMPPRDNKAKAKNLTPEQLGVLKLWIDQGAKVFPKIERVVQWQPLPEGLGAIFAVAVTPDGQFAACSRENRVAIYHLPTGRCVMNAPAHRDQVNALAFSFDGTQLASAGYREVKLWRRAPPAQKLSPVEAGLRNAMSPDGHRLATTGDDGKVKLWAWPAGQLERTLEVAPVAVVALKFSPDGARLACAAADKSLTLWNAADGAAAGRVEAPGEITALAWSPDGQHLATGGVDKIVRTWSLALAPEQEFKAHTGPITALEPCPPNRLVSGSADSSVRIWEVGKLQPVGQLNIGGPVALLAVRPDGQRIATVGAEKLAKLWLADGKPAGELRGSRLAREAAEAADRVLQTEVGTVAYRKANVDAAEKQLQAAKDRVKKSADAIPIKQQEFETKQKENADAQAAKIAPAEALAAAEVDLKKSAEVLETAGKAAQQANKDLDALKAATPPDQTVIDQATAKLTAATLEATKAKTENDARTAQRKQAADKAEPLLKKATDAETALKKADTARNVANSELEMAKAEEPKVTTALAVTKTEVEAAEAIRVQAEAAAKAALAVATAAELPVRAVAFSSDNLTVATAGDDNLVHTWSAETGAAMEVLKGHAAPISALAFTSADDLVSLSTDRATIAWDLAPAWKFERAIGTGETKSPLTDRVNAVAFSHDGKLLATGSGEPSRGGEIKLWDPATGQLSRELPNIHSDTVLGLEFSADDKLLATGAADRMARLVDLATGKIVRSFEGHTHHVLGVTLSPDGRTFASAGADNMVKVWDATSGERKKNIEGYDKEVTAVRFAGATANLVTASGDNKVRMVATDGRDIRAFPEVTDFMQSAAVTADGKTVVAGGQDGFLRVWSAPDGVKRAAFGPVK